MLKRTISWYVSVNPYHQPDLTERNGILNKWRRSWYWLVMLLSLFLVLALMLALVAMDSRVRGWCGLRRLFCYCDGGGGSGF